MKAKTWKNHISKVSQNILFLGSAPIQPIFWPIENWTPMDFGKNSTVEIWPFYKVSIGWKITFSQSVVNWPPLTIEMFFRSPAYHLREFIIQGHYCQKMRPCCAYMFIYCLYTFADCEKILIICSHNWQCFLNEPTIEYIWVPFNTHCLSNHSNQQSYWSTTNDQGILPFHI